jgi:hypothetical protein
MASLAFNTPLQQKLRTKYRAGLSVVPFGLMFASFVPLVFVAVWLNEELGSGLPWLVGFLASGVTLMMLGYALGWFINAIVALSVLSWSFDKVVAVYLRSDVPAHWLKDGLLNTEDAVNQSMLEWEAQRKRGFVNFIVGRGILAWGSPMFIGMYLVPVLLRARRFNLEGLALNLGLWLATGAAFGATMWAVSEAAYRKRKERR